MEKFTAGNGRTVSRDVRRLYVDRGEAAGLSLSEGDEEALREFFLHERDEELGLWRWPENPDYVVYTDDRPGGFRVLHEPTGDTWTYFWDAIKDDPQYVGPWNAARAYFAAHPEPKPWHDAEPGEVWAVTWDGRETPCHVVESAISSNGLVFNDTSRETPGVLAPCITHARRIWPE